jgi:hypothetical protein
MARRPGPGTVIEIALPDGRYAYGRVYRDAALAIYRQTSDEPGLPPIGSRDFRFVVGVYDDAFRSPLVRVVGRDDFGQTEDGWPPTASVRDPITGAYRTYDHGAMRPASAAEASHIEPAAVWAIEHIVARIVSVPTSP